MNRLVVKTVEVDRVRAINGDSAAIDEPGDGIDQAEILVLVVAAKGGWKNNQRQAASVAEDEHFEFAAQIRRPPANVTFVHAVPNRRESGALGDAENARACGLCAKRRSGSSRLDNANLLADTWRFHGRQAHSHRKHPTPPAFRIANSAEPARRSGLSAAQLPPLPREQYPVLYLQDGQNVFDAATAFGGVEWGVDETAQRLIRAQAYRAAHHRGGRQYREHRIHEYAPTRGEIDKRKRSKGMLRQYGKFLIEELKPFIDRKYRTKPEAEFTGLGGSSFGGLATLALGSLVSECLHAARGYVALDLVGRLRDLRNGGRTREKTAAQDLARYRNAGTGLGTRARFARSTGRSEAGGSSMILSISKSKAQITVRPPGPRGSIRLCAFFFRRCRNRRSPKTRRRGYLPGQWASVI